MWRWWIRRSLRELEHAVAEGRMSPTAAAQRVLALADKQSAHPPTTRESRCRPRERGHRDQYTIIVF